MATKQEILAEVTRAANTFSYTGKIPACPFEGISQGRWEAMVRNVLNLNTK